MPPGGSFGERLLHFGALSDNARLVPAVRRWICSVSLGKGSALIVTNRNRTMAVVIRHDGHKVALVPMRGGKLSVQRLTVVEFNRDWSFCDYPLAKALETFIAHAQSLGASKEALHGLESLAERDRDVVASLF